MLSSKINYHIEIEDTSTLKEKNHILAFWHGRLLSAFLIRKYFKHASVLISHNKSSFLVKMLANLFFTSVVKGSTNKGGSSGVKTILQILKNKKNMVFAIAPDGSIGPRMRCNPGVISISLMSKITILPITFSAKRGILLNSWDKFFIPYPFNNITVKLKKPIDCRNPDGSKKDIEECRRLLENTLNKLTWELDSNYNHARIQPSNKDKKGNPLKTK